MVRINNTGAKNLSFKDYANFHYEELLKSPYSIKKKISDFEIHCNNLAPKNHKALVRIIKRRIRDIITATPEELDAFALQLNPLYTAALQEAITLNPPAPKDKTKWEKGLLKIFNYKSFVAGTEPRVDGTTAYYAYDLAEKLDVNVCPYCNRQYTFTVRLFNNDSGIKEGKTRPEFDHFYNQAAHPYLGLSFYNLVPSCHLCNATFKRDERFSVNTHLNPFTTCFNGVLDFTINVHSADFINGIPESFTIALQEAQDAKATDVTKARRNAKLFHLETLYNRHQDLVVELIQKAYYYNSERRKELEENIVTFAGTPLFQPGEVNRFITGVYTDVLAHGKRPMSKLITDIAKELELIMP